MNNIGDLFVILDKHRELTRLDKGRLAEDLAQILAEEVKTSMDAGQAPDGSQWAELSAEYEKWKTAHYPGKIKGELTGAMKAAVQDIPNGIRVVFDRMYIEFAKGDPELRVYAIAFNDGVPERNQPARKFLGFSDRCQERMADCINRFIADGLRGF